MSSNSSLPIGSYPGKGLLDGPLERVSVIAKRRTGRRPSPASLFRWIHKGLRGGSIKLQAVFHAGCWQTTEAAFDAFLNAQTRAALASQQQKHDAIEARLHAAGLLDAGGQP